MYIYILDKTTKYEDVDPNCTYTCFRVYQLYTIYTYIDYII